MPWSPLRFEPGESWPLAAPPQVSQQMARVRALGLASSLRKRGQKKKKERERLGWRQKRPKAAARFRAQNVRTSLEAQGLRQPAGGRCAASARPSAEGSGYCFLGHFPGTRAPAGAHNQQGLKLGANDVPLLSHCARLRLPFAFAPLGVDSRVQRKAKRRDGGTPPAKPAPRPHPAGSRAAGGAPSAGQRSQPSPRTSRRQ